MCQGGNKLQWGRTKIGGARNLLSVDTPGRRADICCPSRRNEYSRTLQTYSLYTFFKWFYFTGSLDAQDSKTGPLNTQNAPTNHFSFLFLTILKESLTDSHSNGETEGSSHPLSMSARGRKFSKAKQRQGRREEPSWHNKLIHSQEIRLMLCKYMET